MLLTMITMMTINDNKNGIIEDKNSTNAAVNDDDAIIDADDNHYYDANDDYYDCSYLDLPFLRNSPTQLV